MRKNYFKWSFILIFIWLTSLAGQAKADASSTTIRLQIKTNDASLYDQDITVTACSDSPTASTTTVNAKCAIEQSGLLNDWSWWGDDAFLNSVGGYINNDAGNGVYWGWFSNLEYGQVALNQHELIDGEKLLLTYDINPLKISTDNILPYVNATSTIILEQFGLDASWNPAWSLAASSTLVVDGQNFDSATGTYEYIATAAAPILIYGKKDGYINSESIIISAVDLATSTIHLQIKTHDANLYDQEITVTACPNSPTATTTSVNAKCAIEQAGLVSDWSWWGEDAFLNSIGSYINNDAGNGVYWVWFSNLEYGQVALNKHELVNGEKLLLAYNVNPLKISVDNATPYVKATSTITVEQFGLDASWNPVWSLAASSTLVIGGAELANETGSYIYLATTSGEKIIHARKVSFLDSGNIAITVREADNGGTPPGGSVILPPSGGGGGIFSSQTARFDLAKAVDFLNVRQKDNGSFGSILITDWAAIALASVNPNGPASQKLKSYFLIDPDPLAGLNPVSDYARRAMALMSLNINPYNGTKTNYIKKITDLFDGRQFGDPSLYNDDIFALIVLSRSGFGQSDKTIKDAADFIISKQQADGAWLGVDLTAAALQALAPLADLDGVSSVLERGRNFLNNAQQADGGFGNIFATAWAMQAISALGESPQNWQKNGQTPESFLALSQGSDGGLDANNSIDDNRLWATAYAIPAIQGKPWFSILNSFAKDNAPASLGQDEDVVVDSNSTSTPTSELTPIVTSTPPDLLQATSTPASDVEEVNESEENEPAIKVLPIPKVLGQRITKAGDLITTPVANNRQNAPQIQESAVEEIIGMATGAAEKLVIPDEPEEKLISKENIKQTAKKILLIAGGITIILGVLLILKLFKILL